MNRKRDATLVFDTQELKKELLKYNQEIYKQVQEVLKEQGEYLKNQLRQKAPRNEKNNTSPHYADSFVVDIYPLEVYIGNSKQVNGAKGTRSRPPLINILNARYNEIEATFNSIKSEIEQNIIESIKKIANKKIE